MNKIETDRKEKVVHVMEISNEKLTEMAALDIKEADIPAKETGTENPRKGGGAGEADFDSRDHDMPAGTEKGHREKQPAHNKKQGQLEQAR